MSDLRRNLDLVAILVLVLLLGVLQAPRVRERIHRVSQEHMERSARIPHIGRLILFQPELR
jgi:hypothetical protein